MFTIDNTEGFNAAELALLNEALVIRIARGEHEKDASDAINNAWTLNCKLVNLIAA
jgi:hypothetical protein